MSDFLLFYLAVQLLGLSVLPLAVRVFRPLPDRGYAFSKFLGLLLLTYLAWLLGMLGFLEHTRATLVGLLVVLGAVCWITWGRSAVREAPPRAVAAAWEGLFLVAFAGATAVRAFNADILGQEKFMDFAFMNAFYTARHLPAEDPWLSGYGAAYYHFGYLVMASISLLAGVQAAVGYNLSVALVLALTLLGSASLVYNAAARFEVRGSKFEGRGSTGNVDLSPSNLEPRASNLAWGLLAAALVGLIGNLQAVLALVAAQGIGSAELWRSAGVKGLQAAAHPQGWPPADFNWFAASRVIPNLQPDGITEFPYFSFLLGDLHPHYQALPYDLLILALALTLALAGRRAFGWPALGVSALALGSLIAASTWDVPTFWLVFAAAALWDVHRDGELRGLRPRILLSLGLPYGLAIALFLPYFVGYASQPLGLGIVAERTPLGSMLVLLGPFLLVTLVLSVWALASGATPAGVRVARERLGPSLAAAVGLALLGLLLVLAVAAEWTLLLLTLLLLLLAPLGLGLTVDRGPWTVDRAARAMDMPATSASSAVRSPQSAVHAPSPVHGPPSTVLLATWFLACFGLVILLAVELLYLSDSFQSRMNTVFKLHYHVWLLLGLASALGLLTLARHSVGGWRLEVGRATPNLQPPTSNLLGRMLAGSLAVVLLGLGSVYPITATYVKSAAFQLEPTLDGARFLAQHRAADFQAITWLRDRADDRAVVLEAVGPAYQEFARVSTFSGLPTVLGWAGHQLQWRGNADELTAREHAVEIIYRDGDEASARALLDRYRVDYVFVGSLERDRYGPHVDTRFAGWLEPAYQANGVAVYRVPRVLSGARP